MTKDQVADILTEIATLLELKGENPFKSRAYVNAARALENSTVPLKASRVSATACTKKFANCWKLESSPITTS